MLNVGGGCQLFSRQRVPILPLAVRLGGLPSYARTLANMSELGKLFCCQVGIKQIVGQFDRWRNSWAVDAAAVDDVRLGEKNAACGQRFAIASSPGQPR